MNNYLQKQRRNFTERRARRSAELAESFGLDMTDSRAARIGTKLIGLALLTEMMMPVLVLAGIGVLSCVPALAQTPAGGIFNSDATTPGRGLVEAIKYFRNLIFLLGIVFFGWAGLNMGMEKPWGGKAMAGAACWGFAGLSALVYTFSQGTAVPLDTNLGN